MPTSLRRRTALAGAVAVVLVGATACSGDSGPDVADRTSGSSTTDAPTTADGGLPVGFGDGPPGAGLQRFYDQQVDWQPCDQGECARVWVPLDYADPGGQAITVEMAKKASTGSDKIGTLFIDP